MVGAWLAASNRVLKNHTLPGPSPLRLWEGLLRANHNLPSKNNRRKIEIRWILLLGTRWESAGFTYPDPQGQ